MQKYLNLWYSLSLDLFGGEICSNAATFFAAGLKGRAKEEQFDDHRALDGHLRDGRRRRTARSTREDVPLRNAMNEVLRDEYVEDCQRGVDKWNRAIAAHGIPFELKLPQPPLPPARRPLRRRCTPTRQGNLLATDAWEARKGEWLPSDADEAYVKSLMSRPIYDPKQMANWIAPPKQGIKGRPVDFEYVRRS